jgi:uncharacterized protein (DUF736 family)
MFPLRPNSVEPPKYGPVCQVVWEGRCREASPYPDQSALCGAPHNAEIGAGWSKRSEEGRNYLSLKLDDPSFNAPIYANLFDDEDGEGYTLIWSRPRKSAD